MIWAKLIQQWQNSIIILISSRNHIEKIWSILYWPLKTFDKASGVYLQPSTFKSQCGVCFRVGKLSILSCSKELMHGYSVIACLASKARVVRVSSSDLEAEIRQHRIVLGVLGGNYKWKFGPIETSNKSEQNLPIKISITKKRQKLKRIAKG